VPRSPNRAKAHCAPGQARRRRAPRANAEIAESAKKRKWKRKRRRERKKKKVFCELGRENERGNRKKDRIIVKVTTVNFNELSYMKVHYSIFR
jgi:hypothetical protein